MKKEEAIENIKLIRFNAAITNANSFKEALDMAIEALSQPSLPSDLDEAAKKWKEEHFRREYYQIPKDAMSSSFKAGAEWMAGQGETHEHYVIQEIADHDIGPAIVCYPETFEIGDKVIVQIRKK